MRVFFLSDKKEKEEATRVAQHDGLRLLSAQCYFRCVRIYNARK